MVYLSRCDIMELLGQCIDVFEDFLEEKGICIQNNDRDVFERMEGGGKNAYSAIIYGEDYGYLSDRLETLFKEWGFIRDKS